MSIPSDSPTAGAPSAPPKQFSRKGKVAAPTPEKPAPAPEPVEPPPSPPPVQPPADPVVEAPAAPAVPVTGEPDAAAIRRQWSTVLDKVRERSRSLAVMLAGAVVRTVDGGTLLLNHESAPLAKRLNEQRNTEVVEEALKDALGVGYKVRYEVGSPANPGSTSAPAAGDDADVARDDEDSMLAEAGSDTSETVRRDPEEAALELLQNELGARRIDGG